MTYDLYPEISIEGTKKAYEGYSEVLSEIKNEIKRRDANIITIECYPGTFEAELSENLIQELEPDLVLHSDDIFLSSSEITERIQYHLTDDRVFGIMSQHTFNDFIQYDRLEQAKRKIKENKGKRIVVYGVGASIITVGDIFIYANLARWEIQKRFRNKTIGNWKGDNKEEDTLRKVKRAYFFLSGESLTN